LELRSPAVGGQRPLYLQALYKLLQEQVLLTLLPDEIEPKVTIIHLSRLSLKVAILRVDSRDLK
jgi:hypothetical protein